MLSPDEAELAWAEHHLPIFSAQASFHEFAKQAWVQIEGPTTPFIDGWHIEAICEHLEAVASGQIKNLIINIPPRCCKSSLVSVMFPAWVWLKRPETKFLCASYALSLSVRDSVKCRRLVDSPWYKARWGHMFRLVSDQNTKIRFENDKNGYRIATSTGGTATGEGGDILLCLPYDSMIMTDIGEIQIGRIVEEEIKCKILSYNHSSDIAEYDDIVAYESNPGKRILEIEIDGHTIECTEDHPVYVEGKGYILAMDVKPGDILICLS